MLQIRTNLSKIFAQSTLFTISKSSIQSYEHGISKEDPLTDTFGRRHTYLRISLTERCNLRCNYCMPEEGVMLSHQSKLLTVDEILLLAKVFVQQGIQKIRLTGGEPTVRKDLPQIISGLKKIEGLTDGVSITTNGLMLTKQLVGLQRAGLDALNISLDTLKSKKFESITRRKGWERVIAGIDLALQLGYNPVKINCVIMKGVNDDEILDFVELTKNKNIDVRFIEYMPFDGNNWSSDNIVPYEKMIQTITKKYASFERLTDGPNDTSKGYKVTGYQGKIGFITSMSEHFCDSCNRLRLTADGNLKVCLFGNTEISLRDALRNKCSESDLIALISAAVKRKKKQHAGENIKRWHAHRYKVQTSVFPKSPFHLSKQSSITIRLLTTQKFTHINEEGKAKMVDTSPKPISHRTAIAVGIVHVGSTVMKLIKENNLKKGDALLTAKLAGILAAKKTSELIPLCHNITLNDIQIETKLEGESIIFRATVKCDGKTGVEMEALTAISVATLTIYDMCKSVSRDIVIQEIKLVEKTGGSGGNWRQ